MKRLALLLLLTGCATATAPVECHQTMIGIEIPDTLRVVNGTLTVPAVDLLANSATFPLPMYRYTATVCH